MMSRKQIFDALKLEIATQRYVVDTFNLVNVYLSHLYLQSLVETKAAKLLDPIVRSLYHFKIELERLILASYNDPGPTDFIFLPVAYNHFDQMKSVARALLLKDYRVLFVTNKPKLGRAILESGFNVMVVRSYDLELKPIRHKYDDAQSHVSRIVKEKYSALVDQFKVYKRTLEAVVNKHQPKALVCGNDMTFEGRLATLMFRRKGILTCSIQHGDESNVFGSEHIVDLLFVFGEKTKASLAGLSPVTNIFVSGAPYLDQRTGNFNPESVSIPGLLLMPANRDYVLVAFSGPGNSTSKMHHVHQVKAVQHIVENFPNLNVIIKLHPKDNPSNYRAIGNKYSNARIIKHHQRGLPLSILDWLSGCSVLITGASTTALEAMSLDVPVLSLDIMQEYCDTPFIRDGAVTKIKNSEELVIAIERLQKELAYKSEMLMRQRPYIADYFFDSKGRSGELIANEIIDRIKP